MNYFINLTILSQRCELQWWLVVAKITEVLLNTSTTIMDTHTTHTHNALHSYWQLLKEILILTCATIIGTPWVGVYRNFQAVINNFQINWGTNMNWPKGQILLVIYQHRKDKRKHKPKKKENVWKINVCTVN